MMESRFEKVCKRILVVISAMILFFLTAISLLFTQRVGKEALGEIINNAPIYEELDNPLLCIGGMIVLLLLWSLLKYDKVWMVLLKLRRFQFVLSGLLSLWILQGGTRTPVDDQIQVCSAAALFNQGNYVNLTQGGYMNMYAHQLGLAMYFQLIFKVFGELNYFAIQCLNCIFIAGMVWVLNLCVDELTDSDFVKIGSSALIAGLLPLYLLSSWAYGDIPSFFFLGLFLLFFLRLCKSWDRKCLLGMLLSLCVAVLLRKNSFIVAIAVAIVLLLYSICRKQVFMAVAAVLIMVAPLLGTKGIECYYEKVSGYEIDGGIPSVMWVTMGMIEGESKPGWFNNYCVSTYYNYDCDKEAAKQAAIEKIGVQFETYVKNPVEGISFYKRKICTQWNDPFFNTERLVKVDEGESIRGISSFLLKHEDGVRAILSVLQTFIYAGALLYCLQGAMSRPLHENVMLIVLVGGFLFSILWEANSRYVFFYVLLLIPPASGGWGSFMEKVCGSKLVQVLKRRKV